MQKGSGGGRGRGGAHGWPLRLECSSGDEQTDMVRHGKHRVGQTSGMEL